MSLETLNAEVEHLKSRYAQAGQALKIEQLETVLPDAESPDRAENLAEVMPEIVASMERARLRWKEFCDSLRAEFAAAAQAKGCATHAAVSRPILFEETCQQSHQAGQLRPAYAPCQECATADAKAQRRRFWAQRGVPERVIEATLTNFDADTGPKVEALGRVREWIKSNGVFLLLAGTCGTGKGHLAAGCLKAQGSGLFITQIDMLADLRTSYALHNTSEVITRWQEAEMFVLDEFGLSPGGKDEEPMLYQVLADRYDKSRPTIITSNLELQALRDALGYRLLDRIGEDCATAICRWPSHRTGK